MANLLKDVTSYIVNKELATGYGDDVFHEYMPEEPNNIIFLEELKGSPDTPFDHDLHHRSIRLITRNVDADTAKSLAFSLHKIFVSPNVDFEPIHFTETRWGLVYIRQTPFCIGTDENDRTLYCFNIGITTSIDL